MNKEEARIFSRYFLKQEAEEFILSRYCDACLRLNPTGTDKEKKLLMRVISSPSLLPYVDSALAFGNARHLVRRKLFIMLAVLETCPDYYEQFNTRERGSGKWLAVFFRGCGAVVKMLIGKLILLFI